VPALVPGTDSYWGKEKWEIDMEERQTRSSKREEPREEEQGTELCTQEEAIAAIEANGEWVYELCEMLPRVTSLHANTSLAVAVLIHSGAIYGGHYYAYIKNLDTGTWLNFNDSNVSEIEVNFKFPLIFSHFAATQASWNIFLYTII